MAVAALPRGEPVVSRRIMLVYVLLAAALIPQMVFLAVTLPDRAVVGHWALAWGGFAIFVAAGLIVTAICVVRNSPWTVVAASATGTVVFVDAWFDLMTRQAPDEFGPPVVRVLLLKAPLGVLCMVATVAVVRRLTAGRNLLGRAGVGWRDGAFACCGPPVSGDAAAERLAAVAGGAAGPGPLEAPPLVAPWVVRVYLVAAVAALLSLIVVTRHPSEALATNWTTAWVGFDLLMAAGFAVTVFAARVRSPVAIAALAADAAILVCDGWFDTMTAHGHAEVAVALVYALAIELPLAVFSLVIARRAVTRVAAARELLGRADVALA